MSCGRIYFPYQIQIIGNIASQDYHAACSFVQDEFEKHPKIFLKPIIQPLFEYQWLEFLCIERKRLGKPAWRIRQQVAVYVNGIFIGDFSVLLNDRRRLHRLYENLSEEKRKSSYDDYMFSFNRTFTYMDISIGSRPVGRLTFMLYSEKLPDTCEKFATLCRGKTKEEVEQEEGEKAESSKTSERGEEEGEMEGREKLESMEWRYGEWRRKETLGRRTGRSTVGWIRMKSRKEKVWEELQDIIEEEVMNICEPREEEGETERARIWYLERKSSFLKWRTGPRYNWGNLRMDEDLWCTKAIEGGAVHVGGVVMHNGMNVVHVQGIVMHDKWMPAIGNVVHIGGIVMHEGEGIVHVQGIVARGVEETSEEGGKPSLRPGHVMHVGRIVVHEGEKVVHVEGVVIHGGWEGPEEDFALQAGHAVHVGGVSNIDGKSVVHVEGIVVHDRWGPPQGGDLLVQQGEAVHIGGVVVNGGNNVVYVEGVVVHDRWEPPQGGDLPIKPGEAVHVGGIVKKDGKSVVQVEGIVEHGQWERLQVGSPSVEPGKAEHVGGVSNQAGENVAHVEGIVVHEKWESPQEIAHFPNTLGHALHVGGVVMHDGKSMMHVEGIVVHDEWDAPQGGVLPIQPGQATHVGGIVLNDGKTFVHVQRVVEHDGWPTEESPSIEHIEHIGGIVVHDGQNIKYIQGIVVHERKAEKEGDSMSQGHVLHIGSVVMSDGKAVAQVEGVVVYENWDSTESPDLRPGRVMHVGGVVIHEGQSLVHAQGIVVHEGWELAEGKAVEHIGGVVAFEGGNIRFVEGIVHLGCEVETEKEKRKFCYKESKIHRIVKGGWIQGGDFDVAEGEEPGFFPDESFCVPFDRKGVLAMARRKRHHTNSTQFLVTLEPTPWMRREYVAFGQLVEGFEVLKSIENVDTYLERPLEDIYITGSGVLNKRGEIPQPQSIEAPKLQSIPTEIFIRSFLSSLMDGVASELTAKEKKEFLQAFRNDMNAEEILALLSPIPDKCPAEKGEEPNGEADETSITGSLTEKIDWSMIMGGGVGNFCGK